MHENEKKITVEYIASLGAIANESLRYSRQEMEQVVSKNVALKFQYKNYLKKIKNYNQTIDRYGNFYIINRGYAVSDYWKITKKEKKDLSVFF